MDAALLPGAQTGSLSVANRTTADVPRRERIRLRRPSERGVEPGCPGDCTVVTPKIPAAAAGRSIAAQDPR